MIRVIIAEDQQLILKDLCNKMSNIDSEINIQATAMNGQDAYMKILKWKPDIVFTDIRMPLMSGIEMIKAVKNHNLDIKFVIISGYQDFEYAREAIKYGVDEYLLKPITMNDLKLVIDNLKVKITMKQNDYEQHVINNLLYQTAADYSNMNISFQYDRYYVLLFNAGPYSTFMIDNATSFSQLWNDIDVNAICTRHMDDKDRCYLIRGKNSNEMICVFALHSTTAPWIQHIVKEVIRASEEKDIWITAGISKEIKQIENIGMESQMIRTKMKKNMIYGQSQMFDCEKISIHLQNHRIWLTDAIVKRVKFAIQNKNHLEFINECTTFIQKLQSHQATQMELEKSMKQLISHCMSYIVTNNDLPDIELEIDECISISKNYDELDMNIRMVLERVFAENWGYGMKVEIDESFITSATAYMTNHYSEDISIYDIASRFGVTPAYFSRLFKKSMGVPPMEYLITIRMKKAGEFLKTTDYSVKEVAELCGYTDPFYFSKAFKSNTGISPTDFKHKHMSHS